MRRMHRLLAAMAFASLAACAGPSPPAAAPLIRCIEIPNGLAECSELPGPTLPERAAR
ncbi:hypothetical protein ROS9278_04365 [Roseomonas sp. CECT 9278]|nr:hypothetical protein ROS9278_04365 [Roseomonas sp. CECT 9278]